MFESHAGILGPFQFKEFSLPYLRDIARRVKDKLKETGQDVPMVRDKCACVCVLSKIYKRSKIYTQQELFLTS